MAGKRLLRTCLFLLFKHSLLKVLYSSEFQIQMHPNYIQLSFAASLADTYPYRMDVLVSTAGSIIAAWKLQQSHNDKHNKRNISMNSSCPYIKLFFRPSPFSSSFCMYVYIRWNKRTCLSKRKKSCVGVQEEKCFSFFRVWHGLG